MRSGKGELKYSRKEASGHEVNRRKKVEQINKMNIN